MNKIKKAFDNVRAEEALKRNTMEFLRKKQIQSCHRYGIRYKYAAVLMAFIVVFGGIGSYSMMTSTVSYISIDINPSIELSLNCFNHVVSAAGLNDDGETILEDIDLKGKLYTDAIDILLSDSEFLSYIYDDSILDFTVAANNEKTIIDGIKNCNGYQKYSGMCHTADDAIVSEAHESGLSLGKYRAYLELSKYDASVTVEECKDMTMHQIHNMIKEHKNESDSTDVKHHGYGQGNGHHGRRNRE